ncbi:MAG: DUF456 domain-containing protein [Mycobacterium sp.]
MDTQTLEIVLVALAIAVGLVGIIVPLLPGVILVWGAIAVWAFLESTVTSWVTLGVVTALIGSTTAIKYMWPAKRMKAANVSSWSLFAGAVLGIIGFFVVPIIGLVLGFVLGVYLAELNRHRNQRLAWAATVHAIKGVGLSMAVELAGALMATGVWVAGVLLS